MENKTKIDILFLSQEDVKKAGGLNMMTTLKTVEEVLRLHSEKKDVLPAKVILRWGDVSTEHVRGRINAMPAYVGGHFNMAGIKWISSFPANRGKGLPRAIGLVILNDPVTGVPLTVMDGTIISAMRTGAVTGVAAKYLARKESKKICMIGTGVIARTNLWALIETIPCIEEVSLFSIDPEEKRKAFETEMADFLKIDVKSAKNLRDAAKGADILVTATTATEPILTDPNLIESGCFIANVGGYEFSFDVVKKADKIIVDDWEQVKHRGTEILAFMHKEGNLKDSDIYSDLGNILIGKRKGRLSNEEIIFLHTVGMGVEDVAVGQRIYETAKEMNLGVKLSLWNRSQWS
jgi:ornithine cyclodeaminase